MRHIVPISSTLDINTTLPILALENPRITVIAKSNKNCFRNCRVERNCATLQTPAEITGCNRECRRSCRGNLSKFCSPHLYCFSPYSLRKACSQGHSQTMLQSKISSIKAAEKNATNRRRRERNLRVDLSISRFLGENLLPYGFFL